MKIHDITHLVRPGIAVWPGDIPYSRSSTSTLAAGDESEASAVTMSLHTGTHVDAPRHYLPAGATIEELDLSIFVGPALLVTVRPDAGIVTSSDLVAALAQGPSRLLLRSNPSWELDPFPERYVSFSEDAAQAIAGSGVILLGTDAPSVDAFGARPLAVHEILGKRGIAILENLRLGDVPDGRYQLVALPLRLADGDASPVRAVLIEGTTDDRRPTTDS